MRRFKSIVVAKIKKIAVDVVGIYRNNAYFCSMKAKYLFLYMLAGTAFLAVSLWVYLSGGKSARAVNAKYRLGGILLTAWYVLSMVSCDVPGLPPTDGTDEGLIMCYDPVPDNYVSLSIVHKNTSAFYQYSQISPGDNVVVQFYNPQFKDYVLVVKADDEEKTVLQQSEISILDSGKLIYNIPLSDEITYKGQAVIWVEGVADAQNTPCSYMSIEII